MALVTPRFSNNLCQKSISLCFTFYVIESLSPSQAILQQCCKYWHKTGSRPIFSLRSNSLVCIENHLFIVGIEPILNKELEFIFWSDRSNRTCVYSYRYLYYTINYIYCILSCWSRCLTFIIIRKYYSLISQKSSQLQIRSKLF